MPTLRSGFLSSEFFLACVAAVAGYAVAAPGQCAPWWRVVAGVTLALVPVVAHASNRTALKDHALEIEVDARHAAQTAPQAEGVVGK
jgi:hypothetical protein